jgi:SAM-dependent methyltransferase
MRLALRPDSLLDRVALWLGLVPTPAAEAWGGMALSGVLVSAVRLGLFARLASAPAATADLAAGLGLDPTVTRLLLECLAASGYVDADRTGRWHLSRTARRWLDPSARHSVAHFVAATQDYWLWWQGLAEVARTGRTDGHHDYPTEDPYWRRYLLGQHDLARLTAAYVVRRLPVPPRTDRKLRGSFLAPRASSVPPRTARKLRGSFLAPRASSVPHGPARVLDIGGGHGLYAVELCRRHPQLTATVLDLPGSAAIGREMVAAAGLTDRIRHVDGDARTAPLGEAYDLVLCFNLVHHLHADEVGALFARAHAALAPGGYLAVMDAFAVPSRRTAAAATVLNLFTYLSSGVAGYTPEQLSGWLTAAGFTRARRVAIPRIPGQALFLARRRR